MRKTHIPGLRALLIGAISLGLSLPAVAAARSNDAPAKASVHKKSAHAAPRATGKKVGHAHTRAHKASRVSRYGKRRAPVAHMSAAERQRLATLANLPHRVGPTEVFQAPGAQSSLYLQSRAAVVMNAETGEVLYSKNSDRTMPIASITKLMTAMVVLDAHLPMDAPITITEDDVSRGAMERRTRESLRAAKSKAVADCEKSYIVGVLIANNGNVARAASAAKKHPRAFRQLIHKYAIDLGKYRAR